MALVPDGALMQRAAAGLASVCVSLLRQCPGGVYGARVVILAGTGDNGGDALYAGERLARRGAAVTAIRPGRGCTPAAPPRCGPPAAGSSPSCRPAEPDDTRPDAAARYDAGRDVRHAIGHADLIIDGLLGIGGKGGLREPFATLAQLAANSAATTLAVDLPSGIDADTGEVEGPAVRADVTVTFGAFKPGLLIDPGSGHAGVVELVDIGLGPYLDPTPEASAPQAEDIAELLPRPGAESDKYRRGVLGLLAGSDKYTGAALLSTGGAVARRRGHGPAGHRAAARRRPCGSLHPEVVITELPRHPSSPMTWAGCRRGSRDRDGDRRGGGRPACAGARDQPPGAHRRGRADAARQAPGAAAARRADAAHPARGRARPAARGGPGRRGGPAA